MTENFELAFKLNKRDLLFRIRDRVKKCNVPQCWELKDPDEDRLYLSRVETMDRKGRHVQLRRLLFYLEYGFVPRRRVITMYCGNNGCINPAHMKAKGFEPPKDHIIDQIKRNPNILTFDQANKWQLATAGSA
jgi:hypothetical protein